MEAATTRFLWSILRKRGKQIMADSLVSLNKNPDIIKLLEVLNTPGMETQKQDYESIIKYIDTLENQYSTIRSEIAELKSQISGIKDKKNPFVAMAEKMDSSVSDMRTKLMEVRDSIISFTKNTLETIRDKGLTALGSVSGFLKIKDGLQAMSSGLEKSIANAENTVNKIEAMSREYHEIGSNVRNIGRIFTGREINEEIKANGRLAEAMELPFVGIKNAFTAMDKTVNIAAAKVENLESYNQEKAMQVLQTDIEKVVGETVQSGKSVVSTEISPLLTEFQPELSRMSEPELRAIYREVIETGMSKDITADENDALQAMIEKIEVLLPQTGEYEATEQLDLEYGVEM